MKDDEDRFQEEPPKNDFLDNSVNSGNKIKYKFCPNCGKKLPEITNLKYCTNCGVDLNYVKEHGFLPPTQNQYYYSQPQDYSQYPVTNYPYKQKKASISEEELPYTGDKELWGTIQSIGFPILAFIIMNGLILAVIFAMALIIYDVDLLLNIISNPFFIVFATLVELMLIVFPIWYAGKFLNKPTFENRLKLLGFTTKGFEDKEIVKEVLIGLGFAVVGLFIVAASSIAIQFFIEFVFNVRIINEAPTSDADVLITGADILVLILMMLMMILVVGPCEEILFRGFMMRGLTRTMGDNWGLIITAIIFAVIHLVGLFIYIFQPFVFFILFLYLFAPYLAISLMLGYLYRWRNENLIAVIVTHGVYNSLTILIAFFFTAF
ncbi:MAG: CPBP family intramembrane metalloprotease [Candidatus Lokiarchaeota archaeon]|nr:CPBP family intramembrane metalloprotease [Candidatus Lokiarchaeota archaeon]MBD3340975.1 CPBP family intramembrane metalloprotease [Candidatus Lokiarchaeota archaeon]